MSINTYRAAFQHATTDRGRGWELKPFILQIPISLSHICEIHTPLSRHRPILDERQHFVLHIGIEWSAFRLQEGYEVIHKLARRNFSKEVSASILHASIRQLNEERKS